MSKCVFIKRDGSKCTRSASIKSGHNNLFCWQHQECKMSISKKDSGTKIPIEKKISKIPIEKKTSKIPIAEKTIIEPTSCPAIPYEYYPNFYSEQETVNIIEHLQSLPYDYTYYYLFSRITRSPRKMIWYAENHEWTYHFSNNHIGGLFANKFTPELLKIKMAVEVMTKQKFNALLINEYHPKDSIAWHSDDDPWLGKQFIVPSLSFGAERTFKLKIKNKSQSKDLSLKLENGSLVIMLDKCQDLWVHSVPKETHIPGIRYNLTFRYIVPSLISKQPKGKTWEKMHQLASHGKIKSGEQYLQ